MGESEIQLRYGCNPHQKPARVCVKSGTLPIRVLNGKPGYINLLDALNSWQLVRELKRALNLPAAASFKHVSPAGAAVGVPLTETLSKAYFMDDIVPLAGSEQALSALATAYARARGADRMSSYGDWAALSDVVDVSTARVLRREVSDGIIAPGYEADALALLKEKKNGKYNVVQIDPAYEPGEIETREVFGIAFEQRRNDLNISSDILANIVTRERALPEPAKRDLLIALITLKYTQSNSVCLARDGQVIGVGAGQQSRIHCTRLASAKADTWYLRQHPAVLDLRFRPDLSRADRDNAIDLYLLDDTSPEEQKAWAGAFDQVPRRLSAKQKRDWLDGLKDVALGSDAYIPFRDNVDRAQRSGVKYIAQPGGSLRDENVIGACDDYGMVMVATGARLFHH